MVTPDDLRAGFAARLKKALSQAGVEEWGAGTRLARWAGVTPKASSKWLNAEAVPGPARLLAIADALGVRREWLEYGEGDMLSPRAEANVQPTTLSAPSRRYPVISWVQAGAWSEAEEPWPPGFSDRYEVSDYESSGAAFWLEVRGDSMTAPSGQSIPEGHLILVDPDVPATHGRLVVAKLPERNEATFKKLVEDGGMRFLKPLNPAYPMIRCEEGCRILGVAVRAMAVL